MRIFCPAIALSSSFYSCTAEYLVAHREECSALAPPFPWTDPLVRPPRSGVSPASRMDSRHRSVIVGVAPGGLAGLTGVSWFGAPEHACDGALSRAHPGDPAGATGLSCQTPHRLIKSSNVSGATRRHSRTGGRLGRG